MSFNLVSVIVQTQEDYLGTLVFMINHHSSYLSWSDRSTASRILVFKLVYYARWHQCSQLICIFCIFFCIFFLSSEMTMLKKDQDKYNRTELKDIGRRIKDNAELQKMKRIQNKKHIEQSVKERQKVKDNQFSVNINFFMNYFGNSTKW